MYNYKKFMIQKNITIKNDSKQRLTAFIDPILVRRAKVRGALEGLTISEVVEKALDAYAPMIEKSNDHHIKVKFINYPARSELITDTDKKVTEIVSKHTKTLAVPR
jgi:hypothetical protein